MRKVKTTLIASAFLVALAPGAASAAPVITDWAYTVSAVFNTSTNTSASPTFSSGTGCTAIGSTEISWGRCSANTSPATNPRRSGIGISDTPATGTLQTNGAAVPTTTYTHYNSGDIGGGAATLKTAVVESTLTLQSLSPLGSSFGPATLNYGIKFLETTNSGNCVVASTVPCDDIFVFQGVLNNAIEIDDNIYFISFFETTNGLKPLSSDACLAAGAGTSCMGFTTPENDNTSFNFSFTITSEPVGLVPEPGSIALIGLGLAGMALVRRRRSQHSAKR